MGKTVYTRSSYTAAASSFSDKEPVTRASEQKAHKTGKLEPLVDPSGFGVIRLSLPRVEKQKNGKYKMNVGTPMPVETRVDTTGSMGGNVDVAFRVLPDAFELWTSVLEGYDLQIATGIFGDVRDRFPLCRPQFEMHVEKIVKQLSLMVPERDGGDEPEDPDLGMFGGAYLCRHYINRIGLKGYDFTVTDAPGRGLAAEDQLKRVYGDEVFDKVAENGHQVRRGTVDLASIWEALMDRAHAFVLQVGSSSSASSFWKEYVGDRLVKIPDTKYLPHVQGAIIGLTEGSLTLTDLVDYLKEHNLKGDVAKKIADSVVNVPIGAQTSLKNYKRRPQKGDLFEGKPDVWEDKYLFPVDRDESIKEEEEESEWV